ncbi:MAG: DNA-3-methyladenine glycosylase [Caulobacteraceae bacterium]
MSPAFDLEEFLVRPIETVARDLIGLRLTVDGVGGAIVETEAYHRGEPASHAYPGLTARNAVMFGPVGHIYVYRSYGIHWCVNIVAGTEPGCAVLIRALEPQTGVERMRERRGVEPLRSLCSGPGKLCQALGVTREHNGLFVETPPFALGPGPDASGHDPEIAVGPRIGITRAMELPWRFGLAGSPFLSRPFPRGA